MGGGERAPYFVVREGYAYYRGPVAEAGYHRHAAFQVAVAEAGEVAMADAAGQWLRAPVLVVPPMVRHRLAAIGAARMFFVDPHCAFADRLRSRCGAGITAVPELAGLAEDELRRLGGDRSGAVDARLRAALAELTERQLPLPVLAARVGLSPQRLRALAGQQLGMPLARWRIWQRLVRSARALGEGQSLAEAALTGGFADQAHFSRQLREMMGLTPSAVLPLLRASAAAGGVHGDRAGEGGDEFGLADGGEAGPGDQVG
ncbi:helix-turn-helix domain-containing protein [Kitasatospora sp. NPDC048365]|uniref:helix-turn-helix domain-containing protein n=1 Tax=Kitasatospora sp. NPDC048365 TaxID=3364050 RepID=UPI0037113598